MSMALSTGTLDRDPPQNPSAAGVSLFFLFVARWMVEGIWSGRITTCTTYMTYTRSGGGGGAVLGRPTAT